MAVKLTGEGDTEEDEALVQVDKVKLKQHPIIGIGKGKGKQCDNLGQQSDCESCLQLVSYQPLTRFFSVIFSTSTTFPRPR